MQKFGIFVKFLNSQTKDEFGLHGGKFYVSCHWCKTLVCKIPMHGSCKKRWTQQSTKTSLHTHKQGEKTHDNEISDNIL